MPATRKVALLQYVFFSYHTCRGPYVSPVLAEDAIRSAIRDYHSKRKTLGQQKSGFVDVTQGPTTSAPKADTPTSTV